MGDYKLSLQETERINAALKGKMQALDRVIDEAGRVVAKLTQYPAFAITAPPERVHWATALEPTGSAFWT